MESLWSFSSSVSESEDKIYCTFVSAVSSELFLGDLNLSELLEMVTLLIACIPVHQRQTSMAQSHLCNIILCVVDVVLSLGLGAFRPANSCHLQQSSRGIILIPFRHNQMLQLGRQSEDASGLKGPSWKSKAILDTRKDGGSFTMLCHTLNKQCFSEVLRCNFQNRCSLID